jgi:hypothetical protein
VDLDFKEDQLAIEAHVRMRCGWRDETEVSEEEYSEFADEYMDEHPFESGLVMNGFEAIYYDRCSGEFEVMRHFPGVPFCWTPGYFWYGVHVYWLNFWVGRCHNPSKVRLLAEYFGLVEPAYDD